MTLSNYYQASAHPKIPTLPLQGHQKYDVCVIGGGITGLSTALHLRQRGYQVCVLEAEEIGFGASGRNGGQFIFGFGAEMESVRRLVGIEDAHKLWELSLEAIQLLHQLVQHHQIQCDWTWGHLHTAIKHRHLGQLREWQEELEQQYQYSTTWLEGNDLEEQVRSSRYLAGLYDSRSGHLHPLNYTLGLARAAQDSGVDLFENARVKTWTEGNLMEIQCERGTVAANFLVLAGNAYLGNVGAVSRNRLMPVGTYMIATEPLPEHWVQQTLPGNPAVADLNFVLDYFRLSADQRLLFGGGVSYSTLPPLNLKELLRARMLRVFPELDWCQIDYGWGGLVGITINRMPHFGHLGNKVFFAQGFSGHGVALSGLAGQLLAEVVSGTAERFDLFARIPHAPFPGGPLLRMPALVLAMTWYRLRDLL